MPQEIFTNGYYYLVPIEDRAEKGFWVTLCENLCHGKMSLLTIRCMVPHTRRFISPDRTTNSISGINSDGEEEELIPKK